MSSQPLVTIVMPAYNAAPYIAESLDALLTEDYPQLEIVIVDDGSTDDTAEIARRYVRKDSRIHLVTQPNSGVCSARNRGIREARGEYILPVDADDILLPGFIAWAVGQMEQYPKVKVVVPRAEFFGARQGEWRLPAYSPKLLARKNMIPATSLYRRSDWQRVGGYCETLQAREDWEFWINVLKEGGEVVTSPKMGLRYRIHPHSKRMTDRRMKRQIIENLNERHPEFMERELNGPLHNQRSWSRVLNALYRLVHPRRTVVCDEAGDEMKYFVRAQPVHFLYQHGQVIYKRRNELRVLTYQGKDYVVKQFAVPNFINRLVYGWLRKSKAQRSFEYARLLLNKGIDSPRPVAWQTERNLLCMGRSYFVSEKSRCPYTYSDLIGLENKDNTKGLKDLEAHYLRLIAQMVARLHDEGMVHQDLSRGNILFGDGDRVELIDLNRIRFRKVGMDEGCRNFAERLPATDAQRRLMAEAYAEARGYDAEECLRLMMLYNKEKN